MGSWQAASGLGRSCRSICQQVIGRPGLSTLHDLRVSIRAPAKRQQSRQQARKIHAAAVIGRPDFSFQAPQTVYFTDFSVYKGKGAMKTVVISPEWNALSDGRYAMSRQGTLLLEFADRLPDASSGVPQGGERRYDWEKKQNIALSAVELGEILTLDDKPRSFLHDPHKGSNAQGDVIKTLNISRMQSEEEAWYFGLSVKQGGQNLKLGVTVSRAELAVFRSISNYVIPHLLGIDMIMDNPTKFKNSGFPGSQPGYPAPSEPPF